jgi:hypothetical protein
MEIGWTDVGSGGYILVSCAHSNTSLFWNDVSFVPVRVLHKDEKILGRKHIYLPHAQTAIYDSEVKFDKE